MGLIAGFVASHQGLADERRFTYVYEPETLPAGAFEVENWVTLRSQRTRFLDQKDYTRWDLRQEIEYGVTDRYSVALYANENFKTYSAPSTGTDISKSTFDGVSLENRYNIFNPAEYKIGLTLYIEGRYSGTEAELEEKIILGQRINKWKWAVNIGHATEWEEHLTETEGEIEASFGLSRDITKHWSVGLELLNQSILPEYKSVENTAVFLGPTVGYHREKWWTALTVLPQVHGWNFDGNPDGNKQFELVDHERLNVRLLFGVNF